MNCALPPLACMHGRRPKDDVTDTLKLRLRTQHAKTHQAPCMHLQLCMRNSGSCKACASFIFRSIGWNNSGEPCHEFSGRVREAASFQRGRTILTAAANESLFTQSCAQLSASTRRDTELSPFCLKLVGRKRAFVAGVGYISWLLWPHSRLRPVYLRRVSCNQ